MVGTTLPVDLNHDSHDAINEELSSLKSYIVGLLLLGVLVVILQIVSLLYNFCYRRATKKKAAVPTSIVVKSGKKTKHEGKGKSSRSSKKSSKSKSSRKSSKSSRKSVKAQPSKEKIVDVAIEKDSEKKKSKEALPTQPTVDVNIAAPPTYANTIANETPNSQPAPVVDVVRAPAVVPAPVPAVVPSAPEPVPVVPIAPSVAAVTSEPVGAVVPEPVAPLAAQPVPILPENTNAPVASNPGNVAPANPSEVAVPPAPVAAMPSASVASSAFNKRAPRQSWV